MFGDKQNNKLHQTFCSYKIPLNNILNNLKSLGKTLYLNVCFGYKFKNNFQGRTPEPFHWTGFHTSISYGNPRHLPPPPKINCMIHYCEFVNLQSSKQFYVVKLPVDRQSNQCFKRVFWKWKMYFLPRQGYDRNSLSAT